jgi:hypothetical protein
MVLPGLAYVLVAAAVAPLPAQETTTLAPDGTTTTTLRGRPEQFAGFWIYNEGESVNAATGRPERSPRSATQRTPGVRGAGAVGGPAVGQPPRQPVGSAGRGTPTFAQPGRTGQIGPTVAMIQENRSLARDLLEVPESLSITVRSSAVSFIDDLERERVYSTNGVRSRYQLGAARFNAAMEWNDGQFVKRIDAADGFRMTETYFLSEDARRLFVIVRIGSTRKGAPVMGVNRIYDRAELQ